MDNNKETMLHEQHGRIQEQISEIRTILIVMSGKGGVGKTTVAVNCAYALSCAHHTVGILDVDLHGPNTAKMLGIEQSRLTVQGGSIDPITITPNLRAVSTACIGNDPDDPFIWRGPMKSNIVRQLLSETRWGKLDYLIIDSPPGTGDEILSVCQLIKRVSGALIVT
ncbi:MAG: P-loop NTPase, partial [Elusimicrobia bacterium]|nr:P-loop NTPase [Elusimicrobiota bacterium]MBD3412660.1 P-loop NTPase [Elusimicrobiota bacterium]